MHGDSIKIGALRKAVFASSIDDLKAMERCYTIENKAAVGPNGFRFMSSAITELIQIIENE